MSSTDRKMVDVLVKSYDAEEFFPDGFFTLPEMIALIQELDEQAKDSGVEYTYRFSYSGYDSGVEIQKYGKRLETDREYAARLKKEEVAAAKQKKKEERDYQKYLELKKKLG